MNVIQWIVSERILEHIRVPKEKLPEINAFRGFLVDKRFKISNLDLVNDLAKVVEYLNPKE
jgi:hypothetical protein